MSHTFTFSSSRSIALFAASLLIIASAALGGYYGFTAGTRVHFALGLVMAAAAIAGEILKPIGVAAAFDAFGRNAYGQMAAALALALVCLIYSAQAELNFAATVRGDQTAERAAKAAPDGTLKRLELELEGLAPSRPIGELEPLIAVQRAATRGADCSRWNSSATIRDACATLADLNSEAGRAKRRAEIEKSLLDRGGPAGPAIGAADPLADAIARYANALGFAWTSDGVSPWLALIPVCFLEIASALSLVVVRSADGSPPPTPRKAAPRPDFGVPAGERLLAATDAPTKAPAAATPILGAPGLGAVSAHAEAIVRALETHNGRLTGSQRELARLAGLPKTSLLRAVRALSAAGEIRVSVEPEGTVIERLAA